MKLVSFEFDGNVGFGALSGSTIMRMDRLPQGPGSLQNLLTSITQEPFDGFEQAMTLDLSRVRLLPPVPNPGKVICVATNFHEPARAGKPAPAYPLVFTRFAESITGHGAPLLKPTVTGKYDFEGEMAVIIGRPGHKIVREDAMSHVAGYACFNDGSVRDWQKHSTQFTPGKNFHRSASFGPWMVTRDEIPDPAELRLETRVNGEIKQQIEMHQMIFDTSWLIEYFSTFIPLATGDVIVTGTPSGFGATRSPPEFLNAGDYVEVDIAGIGTLSNTVVEDTDPRHPQFM